MKSHGLCVLLFSAAVLSIMAGCRSPIMPSSYTLELPEIPRYWIEVLGRPRWRL